MLEIRKKGNKNFTHIDSDYPNEYGANDITIIFDGNFSKLRSVSGRVIFNKDGYDLPNVTIYDDSTSGGAETFPNISSLKQRLINLGYPFGGGSDEVVLNSVDWGNINGNIENQGDLVTYVAENSVQSVTGSTNIDIDDTDPQNPVVNLIGVIDSGTIT